MGKFKITAAISLAAAIVCGAAFAGCAVGDKSYNVDDTSDEKPITIVQNVNAVETLEKINNPDQGFYRPIFVKMTDDGATYNKNIVNATTQLYHLRIDISAFSAAVNGVGDKPLSSAAVEGLDGLLAYLKANGKNAVVRFAYDPGYNGKANQEPDIQAILGHVSQVCPLLNKYKSTVTAVEAGLIGPWGEMHTSAIADAEHINKILDAFLNGLEETPVLARTPKMIYNYLGITLSEAEGYEIAQGDKAYKLGIFNDGYLGSDNDLGTYSDREKDINFLKKQTEHLPYGGEVVIPGSSLHNIEVCLPEMHEMNLSYLNVEWNDQVIAKWKNSFYTAECGDDELYYGQTAFTYIENRLGCRFLLTGSVFDYYENAGKLDISLDVNNVGFGNMNKSKRAKLLFTDENGETVYESSVGDFDGGNVGYSCDVSNLSGKLKVYLRLYGDEKEAPLYCVRFANDGIWNAELSANAIGEIELK